MKEKELKEEFTTAMHSELLGNDIPVFDLRIMSVYGAVNRGMPLDKALAQYRMTEKQYLDNIDRVLSE